MEIFLQKTRFSVDNFNIMNTRKKKVTTVSNSERLFFNF